MADLQALKQKRDQLTARIQLAEARLRAGEKKQDDRVKILVGAAILEQVKRNQFQLDDLLTVMDQFLARPGERTAVLGDDGRGSEALHRVIGITGGQGVADATGGGESPPTPEQPQA